MLRKTGRAALIAAVIALAASLFFVSCDNDLFGTNKPVDITLSSPNLASGSTVMEFTSFSEISGRLLELEAVATLKSGAVSRDILWDTPTDTTAFRVHSSSNGKLVFEILKSGTYTITASCSYEGKINYKQASCIIKTKDSLTDLYIYNDANKSAFTSGSTISLAKDESIILSAGFNPSGTTQTNVLWSLDSTDIASIDINQKTGLVTLKGLKKGTATLTLSSRDNTSISTSLKVSVQDSGADQSAGPSTISLAVPKPTVEIGKSSQINATVKDSHGNTITDGTVEFSLESDAAKAFSLEVKAARAATVTAVKGGSGYITATYKFTNSEGKEATINAKAYLSVEGYVKSIGTDSGYLSLYKGAVETVAVSYNPSNTLQKGYTASTSDPDVVWINEESSTDDYLKILAAGTGTAVVTLTSIHDSSISTSFNVRVSEIVSAASRVKQVVIGQRELTISPKDNVTSTSNAYESKTLYASITTREDSGAEKKNDSAYEVGFESSDNSIVEVIRTYYHSSENGYAAVLQAKKPGTAVIKAYSKDNTEAVAECKVTVGGALTGMVASRTAFNLVIGTTETITLTPNPQNAVCDLPVISISNDCVSASIERKNNLYYVTITGNKLGTADISFKNGSVQVASVKVTVTEKEKVTARSLSFDGIYGSVYFAQDDSPITFKVNALDKDGKVISKSVLFKGKTTTAGQVTSLTNLGNNTFRISPLNAGSGDWIFYLEDSTVQSTLHVEVGGSVVQGTAARKIVAPASAISLSLAESGKKESEITLSTIPLGAEKSAGTVTWSVSNDNISVERKGLEEKSYTAVVTALKAGSAVITAETESGLRTSINVTVYDALSASNTKIAKAEIVSGSSSGWNRYTSVNKTFDLVAKAYYADGTEAEGELFSWYYLGDNIAVVDAVEKSKNVINGNLKKVTFRTTKMSTYEKPAIITAVSVSNPNVYAIFKVYTVADEPTEKTPFVTVEYSGVSLALESKDGSSMEIGYTVHPASYDASGFTATSSSTVVKAELNTAAKKLKLTAVEEGNAVISVTDGTLDFSVSASVVKKAQNQNPKITAVILDRTYLSYDLADKEQQAITATVYKNGVPDASEKVVWTSKPDDVVKIVSAGNVAYVLPQSSTGEAVIRAVSASNELISAFCTVEVIDSSLLEKTLRSISLSESAVTLSPGSEIMLTVTGQPSGALEGVPLTWTTSDGEVAEVDGNGLVKAVGEGTAKITVTAGAGGNTLTSSCVVTVRKDDSSSKVPAYITLSDSIVRVTQEQMDEVFTIHATVYDQYREEIWGSSVLWTVENAGDIISYETGALSLEYSPKNAGTAVVKASVGTIEAEAKIIVSVGKGSDKTLKSIVISAPSLMKTNESYAINATTVPADAEDALIWTSSDSAMVLSPSNNGRTVSAKASKAGTYTVTVKSFENEEITASKTITVSDSINSDKVTGVVLDARSILLDLADKSMTRVVATVYKGGKASDGRVEWTVDESLKNAIAVRESGNSIYITKKAKGSGYITAAAADDKSIYAVCYVEVVDTSEIVIKGIQRAVISSSSLTLEEGGTHQLTVTTYPADIESTVIWSSSDESVAVIDENGLLKAVKPGRCEITAVVSGGENTITLRCSVYVYKKTDSRDDGVTVSRIEFDQPAVLLSQEKMDETVEVNATVYGTDGKVYKTGSGEDAVVTWSIGNKNVASLTYQNNKAVLAPRSAGKTNLTAMYNGRSNTLLVVTGTAAEASNEPKALKFSPETLTLKVGGTTTVTALVEPAGADAEYAFSITEGSDVITASYSKNSVKITGKKAGVAKIKAILVNKPEITAELDVEVLESTAGVVTAITLDKSYISMEMDTKDLTTVTATAYVDGKVSKDAELVWSLEGITTAEVGYTVLSSSTVSLTKKAVGTGYLVCKAAGNEDVYAKCRIEIKPAPAEVDVESIALSDSELTLRIGEAYEMKTAFIPAGAEAEITWKSSDAATARVSDNGIITGVAKGAATITASVMKKDGTVIKAEAAVTVVENQGSVIPGSIRLSSYSIELSQKEPDKSRTVTATVIATDGYPVEGAVVTWTLENDDVVKAEIDGNAITLLPGDAGKTTLRAWYGNLVSSATIYTGVKPGDTALDHLTTVPNSNLTIQTGTEQVVEVRTYPVGLKITPEWESENTAVAAVAAGPDMTAAVKGVKEGDTVVTVKDVGTEISTDLRVRVRDDITNMITAVVLDKTAISFDLAEKSMASVSASVYVNNTLTTDGITLKWEVLNEDETAADDLLTVVPVNTAKSRVALAPKGKTGRAYLRATASNGYDTNYAQVYVEVVDSSTAPVKITELRCETDAATLPLGSSRTYSTITTPSGIDADIRWEIVSQSPEDGYTNVVTMNAYGSVTGVGLGTAVIKAYVYGSTPEVSDTMEITVVKIDNTKPDSQWEIGSIQLSPARITLEQDAEFPTSVTAAIFDKQGGELKNETVDWNTDGLTVDGKVIAKAVKTEGNTIYLEGVNAGRGELTASRRSSDGTVKSASAYVVTGGIVSYNEDHITALCFNTSSPQYLVAGDGKKVVSLLEYTPSSMKEKGVAWTSSNAVGYVNYTTSADGVTAEGLAATEKGKDAELTALSIGTTEDGLALEAKQAYRVVATAADLPAATSLKLDKTSVVFNIAEKNVVTVTAAAYDYYGNEVPTAVINWSLEDVVDTDTTITQNTGASTGIRRGSKVGTATLKASLMDGGEVITAAECYISVIDSAVFEGISASADEIRLTVGGVSTVSLYGSPSSRFKGAEVEISGSADAVEVTPDADGKKFRIEAVEEGTAVITYIAEVDGFEYTAKTVVYVNSANAAGVDRISLVPASAYLEKTGDKVELTAIVYDKKANVLSENVIYKVSDPSVVDIEETQTGLTVTARKNGTAVITAAVGNVSAESFIMVGEENVPVDVLARIIPAQNEIEMKKNQSRDIMLVTVPDGYSMADFTVTSSKKTVAEGAIVNGMLHITAFNEGSAVITVSEGDVKAEVSVTVKGVAKPAVIKFDKTGVTLTQETGAKETVKAYVYDEDMVLLEGEKIALWQAGDSAVVRIAETADNTVTVEPLNTGFTSVTANAGTVSSSFTVAVNDAAKSAAAPSSIKAAEANVQIKKGESAEISVLYEPTNITDEGRDLEWTSSNTAVAKVEELSTGKAVVTGVKTGTAVITARSTKNDSAAAFNVTVKSGGVYAIELDKTEIRLGYGSETMLTAELTLDGEKIDASDVSWTLEGTDPVASLAFRRDNVTVSTIKGESVILKAKSGHPAYVYVVASYGSTVRKAQIEVADISKQSTGITSVSLDKSLVRMEVGESISFTASTLPETAGVTYEWKVAPSAEEPGAVNVTGIAGNTLTVEASKVGAVEVSVTAKLAGFEDKTSGTAKIEIVEKGAMDTVYKYSYIALDKATVTLIPNGDYAEFNASLYDSESKKLDGTVSAWNVLDSRGELLLSWTADENGEGYTVPGDETRYETLSALMEKHSGCAFSRMDVVGSDNAMLELAPSKPGTYFIEVEGPVEDEKYPEKTVKARAMMNVTADLVSVGLDSSVLHMILGEQVTVNASLSPSDAAVKSSSWTETGDAARLELTSETPQSVAVRAVAIGETGLKYTAEDSIGTVKETDMKITVHDAGYGRGGIRKLAFDNVYETASYPYSTAVYKAKAYFMDGTNGESSAIEYTIQHADETDLDSFEVKNGRIYTTGGGELENGSHSGTLVAAYSITDNGVRITPAGKGMIKITASYVQNGITYSAVMWLTIAGNTTTLSPSSSSIVLYTGGSTEITLTTDNNVNSSYMVDLVEEYTSGGYKIVENQLEGTTTYMPSVFTAASTGTKSGRSITIGTKAFVPETVFSGKDDNTAVTVRNPKDSSASAGDFYLIQGGSITKSQWEEIRGSFPRTATFKVSTADGQASSYITVTVNQLPSGNTYPVNLTLSADKIDLTPPFTSEQTVKAALTDLEGKTTKGTVDWYYYPVGRDYDEVDDDGELMYKLDTKSVTGTATGHSSDLLEVYFSADGLTMYYKPKTSGLYRLTAKCIQNPQLESTSTLNVGGGVTGVTASTGTSVTVEKGSSADITAVFTPTGALARDAYFALTEEVEIDGGTPKKYMSVINDVTYTENPYVNLTINRGEETGDVVTVFGKLKTGTNQQLLTTLYPQTTSDESAMTAALESGEKIYWTLSGSMMKAWKKTADGIEAYKAVGSDGSMKNVEIKVFTYQTTISVTNPTVEYTFKVAGETSINPSAVTGNKLTYSVSTSSSSNEDNSFNNWGWVEAKLIGEDSGLVYASSVPVNADGDSLYQWTDADGNVSSKWYTAEEIKTLKAGGAADGVSASGLKNYNSSKVVYRYFTGADLSAIEDAVEGEAVLKTDESGTKYYDLEGNTFDFGAVYDVQKTEAGTYFYYYGGRETEVSFDDNKDSSKGSLAAVLVPVKVSGLTNGKLVSEDNNQTYSFILNSNAVPSEPLLFKVGISDKVEKNNENSEYYDNEAKVFTSSDQRLYIGGDIQTLTAGSSVVSNNGKAQTSETVTGSLITLIEGASAVLNLTYNPEYTHQKEVTWSVVGDGGKMTTSEYSAIPAADSSSLSFIAYKLNSGLTKTVTLRATSVYNSKVYCDYTIVIQCVVKNIEFTAKALRQVNSADRGDVPLYKLVSDPSYPDQTSDNTIDCYDYTDIKGDTAAVDAYLIEMTPTPKYGYTFKAELIDGSNIGSLDTTNIDESSNSFRFVPIGRIYDEYDADGNPASLSYTVNYDDATIRVTCEDLNYSKDFTINYGAAAGRLVREIATPDAGDSWQLWDTATVEGKHYLYGLEAIVMYEDEEFPVTIIDFNNGQSGGEFFKHWTTNESMRTNSAMMWYVTDSDGNVCTDGVTYCDGDGNAVDEGEKQEGKNLWLNGDGTYNWNGGLSFTAEGGRDNKTYPQPDPRVTFDEYTGEITKETGEEYTGLYGAVCTLKAGKQGIYTLHYTYISTLTNDKGEPQIDSNGGYANVVTKGSVQVYVISKADQTLVGAVNELYTGDGEETAADPFEFIDAEISRSNLDKWFLPSAENILNGAEMYRGRTYLVFDYTHTYSDGVSYTGLRELSGDSLDFTELRQTQFDVGFAGETEVRASSEPLVIAGMRTGAENENEKYSRVFDGVAFEDLILTGEKGVALLDGYETIIVGPYKGETENDGNIEEGNWLGNNLSIVNGKKILDFCDDSIKNLTLKNLDLTSAEGILLRKSVSERDTLESFTLENCIYPKAVFMDGSTSNLWTSSAVVKYLKKIVFKDTFIQSIDLRNFPSLDELSLNGKNVGCDSTRSGFVWAQSGLFLQDVGSGVFNLNINAKTNLLFAKIHIKGSSYPTGTDGWVIEEGRNCSERLKKIDFPSLQHVEEVIINKVYCLGSVSIGGINLKKIEIADLYAAGSVSVSTGTAAEPLVLKGIETGEDGGISISSSVPGTAEAPTGFETITLDKAKTLSIKVIGSGTTATTDITVSGTEHKTETDTAFSILEKLNTLTIKDSPSLNEVKLNKAGGSNTTVAVINSGSGKGVSFPDGTAYSGVIGTLRLENSVKFARDGGSVNLSVKKVILNGVIADGSDSSAAGISFGKKAAAELKELEVGEIVFKNGSQNCGRYSSRIGTLNLSGTSLTKLSFYGTETPTTIAKVDYSKSTVSTSGNIIKVLNEGTKNLTVKNFCFDKSTVSDKDFKAALRTVGSGSTDSITAKQAKIAITAGTTLNLSGGEPTTTTITEQVADGTETTTTAYFTETLGFGDTKAEAELSAGDAYSWTCYATLLQHGVESFEMDTDLCTTECRTEEVEVNGEKRLVHYHHLGGVFFVEKTQRADGSEGLKASAVEEISSNGEALKFSYKKSGKTTLAEIQIEDPDTTEKTKSEKVQRYKYSHGIKIEHVGTEVNPKHEDGNDSDGCILAVTFPDEEAVHYLVQEMINEENNRYSPLVADWHADSAQHAGGYPPTDSSEDKTFTEEAAGKYALRRQWYIGEYKGSAAATMDADINSWLIDRGYMDIAQSEERAGVTRAESVTVKYKTVERTVTSAGSSGNERCRVIDISNSRFVTTALGKIESPSLVVSLNNLYTLKAADCDLKAAVVSTSCQALKCIEMNNNRFGAADGFVKIGSNTYKKYTVTSCDAVVDWSSWGGSGMSALENGTVNLRDNGICVIVDFDNTSARCLEYRNGRLSNVDRNANWKDGQTVKVKIGANASIINSAGSTFMYCSHRLQSSDIRGNFLSNDGWDTGSFWYTVKVAGREVFSDNRWIGMPEWYERWFNTYDSNPNSGEVASNNVTLNTSIQSALSSAGYNINSLTGKSITIKIDSTRRAGGANHHYTKTWIYPFGDSSLFRTGMSDWSWGDGSKLSLSER